MLGLQEFEEVEKVMNTVGSDIQLPPQISLPFDKSLLGDSRAGRDILGND